MIRSISAFILSWLMLPAAAFAAGDLHVPLKSVDIDMKDRAALYRGAETFMARCATCHSAKYMRYGRIADDFGLDKNQLKALMPPGAKRGDVIHSAMPHDYAKKAFGVVPPDLSLIARVRGADWLYTYLTSFYADPSKRWGVNNLIFPGVSMPHVFAAEQGVPQPVYKQVKKPDGSVDQVVVGIKDPAQPGDMSKKDFHKQVRDLVNFMVYMGEPARIKRMEYGPYVLAFLFIFTVLLYLLKREYWRDIKVRKD